MILKYICERLLCVCVYGYPVCVCTHVVSGKDPISQSIFHFHFHFHSFFLSTIKTAPSRGW